MDPTKTIFKIKGLTGYKVEQLLDGLRINLEKATKQCCVITCHINIIEEDIDQLITALEQIAAEHGSEIEEAPEINDQKHPLYKKILIQRQIKKDLRDVLAADSETLPISECVGRISAEIKYVCPPGFPVLVYGEEIQ